MKPALFLASLLFAVGVVQAVTVDQIGKLAELKTKDDLILQLVQKEGLDHPLTTADVIALREKGVSERVIEYLMKLSQSETSAVSKQEGESVYITKNIRAFQTRDKKGKPILMVTNLDENGKRMGPPPPPNPEPEVYREPEPPKEVYVTVRHEEPERSMDEEEYLEEPYYDSGMPYYPANNIPYGGYPYYPVYPTYPSPHHGHYPGNYRFNKPWGSPHARTQQSSQHASQHQMTTPRSGNAAPARAKW
ncbi:MAG TPA: hypothetical protein VLH08_16590 [Acidobacteriota bacterium]|nr:hypothetical protein [Acidobacteriota bacterium]